ncbi:PEP-CTERM protein-sorting domain-containing protein [Verrucomicrobium sp. GAS474]|uniref:PEP-CTERM sorting domain-containing protein n=1 Tax=Verrucomicrobium sp. GAS474 TaxID=1882831 RepID=UPI0008798894|nr:PEP-CTERM sorting domain-containing protein [Verrucomicrobium sp. GAS474]SDT95057.1 PEP-CTERM protein-sorting domain-containing protein [Verrucomicrobium sp. GAS474]
MQTSPVSAFGSPRFLRSRAFLPLFLAACWAASALPARAVLLEYWDFNNVSRAYSAPNIGLFSTSGGNGELYDVNAKTLSSNSANGAIFTTGSLNLSNVLGTYGGSTSSAPAWGAYVGATPTNTYTGDTTGSSLLIVNSINNDVDKLTFSLTSTGYTSLTFTASERLSFNSTSFLSTIAWSYSTDGTTWTSITPSGSIGLNSSYGTLTLALPGTLDNLSTFYIQEELDFKTTQGSFAIDNVQLNGTALAVPEPSTWALLFLGGGLLLWRARRRAVRA